MLYAIMCKDKPNSENLRLETRERHVAYLKETGAVLAGPLLSDDGAQMIGSLVVIEAADRAAAETWAAADPYAKAGLFETTTISAWKRVIG